MVYVNLDEKKTLSLFDAEKKFDAYFIRSFLNILRESTVGFRLLSDSHADQTLRAHALNVLSLNSSSHPKLRRNIISRMCPTVQPWDNGAPRVN